MKVLNKYNFLYRYIFFQIIKISYRNANLITPSIELSKELKKNSKLKKKFIQFQIQFYKKGLKLILKKYDFINIGSLSDQKDHLTLLKAFKYAHY